MGKIFTSARASLGTTSSVVYTVPVDTTSIIIGCQATNVDVATQTFSAWWTDASNANVITRLANVVNIPDAAAYEPIGGRLVLNSGDTFVAEAGANDSIEITLSILEMS
ncbi:MAG: hypothetical protein WD432_02055 [Candidatus Saccharimonadales bacterium]